MEVDFQGVKALIIGDFVLDKFLYTTPIRLSREAPVVIVRYDEERFSPGACGNTAMNLLSIGVDLIPATIIGDDEEGEKILSFFEGRCPLDGIIKDKNIFTVVKTRILSGDYHTSKQQILRIDRESRGNPSPGSIEKLCDFIKARADEVDIIIVSDYGYSTLQKKVVDTIAELSGRKRIVVDSRYRLKWFKGVFAATPNEREAEEFVGLREVEDFTEVGKKIKEELSLEILLLTRGNKGMLLFEGNSCYHIPISGTDEVVDVTGAGDTVCAVFSAAVAKGYSPLEAALLANYAAGVVVTKRGTTPVNLGEIKEQVKNYPVKPVKIHG